jgi:flagellar basal body-associated protein FliL
MKIVVIIVIVVMVIAGVTFGVMKSMELGPFAVETMEGAINEDTQTPATYISLDPLTVNVISGNKIITTLRISIQLDVRGDDKAEFVHANLPKVASFLLQDMHAFLPRVISSKDKSLDVFLLKKRLKLAMDKLFPNNMIHNVLIQSIDVI